MVLLLDTPLEFVIEKIPALSGFRPVQICTPLPAEIDTKKPLLPAGILSLHAYTEISIVQRVACLYR